MKLILLSLLMAATVHGSDIGDARQAIYKIYASDPVGAEKLAIKWNYIMAHLVNRAGIHPLTPLVDYKDQSLVSDDPTTKEVKQVKMMLNDLRPILILTGSSKHRFLMPRDDNPDPLMRTNLTLPPVIEQPANATR